MCTDMGRSIWITTGSRAFLSRKCLFFYSINKVLKIHRKLIIILDHEIFLREAPGTRNMAQFVLKS